MNETMVTVVGNVISDVQRRETQSGVVLASFRMASNERRFDKATGQWVDGDRLYVSVTCWRRLALGVTSSLEKGDPIVVRGRLFTRNYEIEGNRRTVTELEAYQLGPDLSRCQVCVERPRKNVPSVQPSWDTGVVPGTRRPEDAVAGEQSEAGQAHSPERSLVGAASDN